MILDRNNTHNFTFLEAEAKTCDKILEKMETILTKFYTDLSKINSEIQHLQSRSTKLGSNLKNREMVQTQLRMHLNDFYVSPQLIHAVCSSKDNAEFCQAINELNMKFDFVSKNDKNYKAVEETKGIIDNLITKACSRIRDLLLDKILSLKRPNVNLSMTQQFLCKQIDFYNFLSKHKPAAAQEVYSIYTQISKSFYSKLFSKYIMQIGKVYKPTATRKDKIGFQEKILNLRMLNKPKQHKSNVYSLGDRLKLLEHSFPVIVCHSAIEREQFYKMEELFDSLCRLLVDNCCSELVFLQEFFSTDEMLQPIFAYTLNSWERWTCAASDDSYDAIGLLICVKIAEKYEKILQNRQVDQLNATFKQVQTKLWMRFNFLFDRHIQSVKKYDIKRIRVDTTPQNIIRLFSEFSLSILTLNEKEPNQSLKEK